MRHQPLPVGINPLGLAPAAALAIARNRASKVDLLIADRSERCMEIARSNVDSLAEDVCEFIANGGVSARDAQELCNIVTCARDRWYGTD